MSYISFNNTVAFANVNETCFDNGFYNCEKCQCDLTPHDLQLNLVLGLLSTISVGILVVAYFFVKRLRQSPGDLLFGIIFSQFIFALMWTILVIKGFGDDYLDKEFSEQEFCQQISIWTFFSKVLFASYNIVFFVFLIRSLSDPLKSASSSTLPYHFVAWTVSVADLIWRKSVDGLGLNMYGGCEDKTTRSLTIPIIYLSTFIIVPIYTFYKARKSLPNNKKLRNTREQFLNYYTSYVAIISFMFIGLYSNDIFMILNSRQFTSEFHPDNPHGFMRIFRDVGDIFRTFSAFVITAIRFSDPMIKSSTKRLFRCCKKKSKNQKQEKRYNSLKKLPTDLQNFLNGANQNQQKLIRSSFSMELDSSVPQNQDENNDSFQSYSSDGTPNSSFLNNSHQHLDPKSYMERIQRIMKTQLVYSLLSSFYYFWKKTDHSKLDYQKHSQNSKTIKDLADTTDRYDITDETLRATIPEIVNQVKDQNYYISDGLLTVYSPKLFSYIAQLDDQDVTIIDSLDVKENFQNILKAGVNGGGKSGEFFFFSHDNKLIIKTISDRELQILISILPDYAKHLTENPFSMITKIYSAFTFETTEPAQKYNLILMRNLNGHPSNCIQRKYDLKGSTVGRIQIKNPNSVAFNDLQNQGILKDLDFKFYDKSIKIDPIAQHDLYNVLANDAQFLRNHGLIDYSLAIYLIDKEKDVEWSNEEDHLVNKRKITATLNKESQNILTKFQTKGFLSKELTCNPFESLKSTNEDLYYHMGIIDYLNDYNYKKRMEVFFKKLAKFNPKLNISVQNPTRYATRFTEFMKEIILDNNEGILP